MKNGVTDLMPTDSSLETVPSEVKSLSSLALGTLGIALCNDRRAWSRFKGFLIDAGG